MRLFATLLLAIALSLVSGVSLSPTTAYGENSKNARTFPPLLNCQESKSRIDSMLDLHFYYNEMNDELSQRTIKKIFENLDQNKVFFIKQDIEYFQNNEKNISKKIKINNCDFLFEIHKVFIKRVHERMQKVKSILTKELDFNKTDYINIAKQDWPISSEDANEKIKKRIKLQFLSTKQPEENDNKVRERLLKNFVRLERKFYELDNDKLYSIFLNSFALAMDPHSAHMLPSDHDSFVIHISNKLEGIGAQLQEKDGYIVVRAIIPGGVAQKDGRLKEKDKIIAVDSGNGQGLHDLIDTDVDQAVNLIRGKKGSPLKLIVLRKNGNTNEKLSIVLTRDEIDLKEDEVKTEIYQSNNGKVGIIKIPTFYTDLKCKTKIFSQCKGVSYDVERGIRKLTEEGINGLLIDLRNNGGGDFPESVKLTGLFIPNGTAVQTVDKTGTIKRLNIDESNWIYKGPLVILINRYSASASEIFVGAMQDYGRGIIVGDKSTYGKATVQIVQEIPGTLGRRTDGAIKVTQSKFYRPAGTSNQKQGVHANIVIPSILESYDIGEEQLDFALPSDVIPPAKGFKPLQDLSFLINRIKFLSQDRINRSKKFQDYLVKINKIKLEKNKLFPITKDYFKIIEEQENPRDLNEESLYNIKSLINENDLQFMEALNITMDSIKLSGNQNFWVGMSSK